MADEDEIIKKEINYEDEEQKEEDEEKRINRPESPRTTAARYLLDLANFGSGSKNIIDTQTQHKQDATMSNEDGADTDGAKRRD